MTLDEIDRLRDDLRERYKNHGLALNRRVVEFEEMVENRLRTYLKYGSPNELLDLREKKSS